MEEVSPGIKNAIHIIEIRSGFHALIEKEFLKFNYVKIVNELNDEVQKELGKEHVEIVKNKNNMIPSPGTLQAGFPVKFLS